MPKNAEYLETIRDLEPGATIIFQAEKKRSLRTKPVQYLIMFLQSVFSWQNGGHFDSTHVAIVSGKNPLTGEITIDHAAEMEGRKGYVREDLGKMLKRQGGRCFMAFKPESNELADEIVRVCNETHEKDKSKPIRWSVLAAAWAFIQPTRWFYNKEKKKEDWTDEQRVICSEEATRILKTASRRLEKNVQADFFPAIRSSSSPKALEGELRSKKYRLQVYTDSEQLGGPYQVIKKEVLAQISRLYKKENRDFKDLKAPTPQSTKKSDICYREFLHLTKEIESSQSNELDKAMYLLKHMSPFLKMNTGIGFREATAHSSVFNVAREMGIHKEDVLAFDKHLERGEDKSRHRENQSADSMPLVEQPHHGVHFSEKIPQEYKSSLQDQPHNDEEEGEGEGEGFRPHH